MTEDSGGHVAHGLRAFGDPVALVVPRCGVVEFPPDDKPCERDPGHSGSHTPSRRGAAEADRLSKQLFGHTKIAMAGGRAEPLRQFLYDIVDGWRMVLDRARGLDRSRVDAVTTE